MNRVKLRNFGLAITAAILCSLFAVSAQAATVSDTDDDLTIKLTISPTTIIKNTDAVWGTLTVTITEDEYKLKKGDYVELAVYDNDCFLLCSGDSKLWSTNFQVTRQEQQADLVHRIFDVNWLAIGTSYSVYATADVDKSKSWSIADDSAQTGEIQLSVEPPSAVPIPAAAWLFGSAILGLLGVARRKKA
jgi:hypothetical protein